MTLRTRPARGAESASPYVPLAVTSRYQRPRATIDPDRSKSWLRRARPIVLAHKGIFGTSLVLSFVALVIQVQIPNQMRLAIDSALVVQDQPLAPFIWIIVILAVVRGLMMYVSRRFLFETAYAIEYDLRNNMYEHLTRLSFPFYDRVQTGQLISRANSDIRSVQMYLAFAPSILVQCAVAVVAFVQMLTINVPLAFVAMAPMPFVYITGVRMRRVIFPASWLIQARLADVATIVNESVEGTRVVKSFAAEPQQLTNLARSAERAKWAVVKEATIRARFTPLMENLPRLGTALILLVGGWLAIEGHTTVGTIVAFNAYVLMLQPPFRMLGMLIMMGRRAAASAGRMYAVLDVPPEIVDRPGAVDLVAAEGDITFDDVSFGYADGPAVLSHFDVRVRPGETVAIVGRTGSGKSTVSRLLTRFYDVTEGSVRIDGHDTRDLTVTSLRAHVGVVFDEPFLFSVSIRDNIAYGRPGATDDEVAAAALAAQAHEFIVKLPEGYDTVIGERGYTLSGGQRQRIAIARTLLMNPPILVLDDATSAIDVQVEASIHEGLRLLMADRTTLIISHRLSTISLAERVLLVADGHLIADGTHAQLLADEPRYGEILAEGMAEDEAESEASALHGRGNGNGGRPDVADDLAELDADVLAEFPGPRGRR